MDTIVFLRQFRIGPFAIFDIAISYLGIYLLSPLLTALVARIHIHITRNGWLWLMFPISVVFHALFRQNTPIMQRLFDPTIYYAEIPILLFMTYMGLKDTMVPIKK